MMELEDHLRAALCREAAPPDFAARVVLQTRKRERESAGWRSWAAGAMAASILLGATTIAGIEQRREQDRARVAAAQLVQAIEITSAKLHRVGRKLENLNR